MPRRNRRRCRSSLGLAWSLVFCSLLAGPGGSAWGQEIGFLEDFALAEDREIALKQLIPGTEDYYYFHCLHYQNTEQYAKVDAMLKVWVERHGRTPRLQEITYRQALLTYSATPDKSLEFVRSELNLRFNHRRQVTGEKPDLPTRMDSRLITRQQLLEMALRRNDLGGLEASANHWLAGVKLSPDKRRLLLQRLDRPDIENLVDLVDADLKHERSGGFGSLSIHRLMLRSQLDELAKRQPKLLNQSAFVRTYLTKLAPGDDEDWQYNDDVKQAHLDRLWSFVSQLGPVHNSLKAHVLYRQLVLDRSHGEFNRERFETYLRLPRNAPYVNPEYLRRDDLRRHICNLGEQFAETGLPPVGNDEPLVRSYLLHFFVKDADYEQYLPLIRTDYLKHLFAEAKIVNHVGNPEQWASLLPPAKFQALKERVDLDFLETNKRLYSVDDNAPVSLDLQVKNVETLLIKVFRVNAEAFYRSNGKFVNTDIELDGLIPNSQRTIQYQDPPLHRVRRHFEFPELAEPGVYVIDFIGNGRSSRALIQKGRMRAIPVTTPDGQLLTVVDDDHRQVKPVSVLLDGKVYESDEEGRVLTPFSTKSSSSRKPIVILHGDHAFLDHLTHQPEGYSLSAGIFVSKESLLARREGRMIIRPQLKLNGEPVSVTDLEDVQLTIVSQDLDGVGSTQTVTDLELRDDRALEHVFLMPPRIASVRVTLSAAIKPIARTTADKVKLSVTESIPVNNFDPTELVADLHLAWVDNEYVVMLLGRTGEPLPDRAVQLRLKHRDFTSEVNVSLKTDDRGIVELGRLPEIASVAASHGGADRRWPLRGDDAVTPSVIHGVVGEPVQLPLPEAMEIDGATASLLEMRRGQFVADRLKHLKVDGGLLSLENLPAGDYDLLLREPEARRIRVRITEGPEQAGFACGAVRWLELRLQRPLAVRDVALQDGQLQVQLQNATPAARVHIIGSRIDPAFSCIDELRSAVAIGPQMVSISRNPSAFVEGRQIGEEYRYILERKLATKFPGNMLARPSLLLNPWALRSTSASKQEAQAGEAFDAAPAPEADASNRAGAGAKSDQEAAHAANLDFLAGPGVVLANIRPDEDGRLAVDLDLFADMQQLRVVAADTQTVVERAVSLPAKPWKMLDLRMADILDPSRHYVQRQATSMLKPDETIHLASGGSRVRTYDSLSDVYQLMTTLNSDDRLQEFRFVLQWPDYDDAKKRELYSRYASHELNFFLAHKDPKFFDAVVKPYMANKRDKTFLDEFLLDQNLLGHVSSWEHGRLNIVERILIGHSLRAQTPLVRRHVRELFELLPPDPQQAKQLFDSAISNEAWAVDELLGADVDGDVQMRQNNAANGRHFFGGAMGMGGMGGGGALAEQGGELAAATEKQRQQLTELEAAKRKATADFRRELDAKKNAEADEAKPDDKSRMTRRARQQGRTNQLYQQLESTKEWAENNYYHRPIEEQNSSLVEVNAFWNDYARHPLDQPFLSEHFPRAAANATESMLALAVLDLPFEAGEHERKFEGETLTITAASPAIVLHEELKQVEPPEGPSKLLVSQNFFQQGDRYRYDDNVRLDKYVTDEFVTHTVYGCQVVVTNPTSTPRQLQLLFQLPAGAIAVANGKPTNAAVLQLDAYATVTAERLFYFPTVGQYDHFPVHISQDGELLTSAEPQMFNVVESLSRFDRTSWDYISQNGTQEDVLRYLKDNNLQRTDLSRIAFRMQDPKFFTQVVDFLAEHRAYDRTLWSYSVKHNQPPRIDEFLRHEDEFVGRCGMALDSPLLHVDPIERRRYQHLDYRPLVNARTHRLGARRRILNDRLHQQYDELLRLLSCRRELSDDERMSVTYYLLLQDRVEAALNFFESVNRERLATKVQYDYFTAYTSFYKEDVATASRVAAKYEDHPVDRWRLAFDNVRTQIDEINGANPDVSNPDSRDQALSQLAANSPSLELSVDGRSLQLNYRNLDNVELRFYEMDVELLFSRNPFVQQQGSGQFAYIQPNLVEQVELPEDQQSLTVELPAQLLSKNVLIEARAGGVVRTQARYANTMTVQIVERFGSVRVTDSDGKPLSKVYVKAYAKLRNGAVKFYKDGYTDLRGRFDYASLSTNDLDQVQRFSLLVLSEEQGAKVSEAAPPAR